MKLRLTFLKKGRREMKVVMGKEIIEMMFDKGELRDKEWRKNVCR